MRAAHPGRWPRRRISCAEVTAQPNISLAELCGRVKTAIKLTVSPSRMARDLTRLRLRQMRWTPVGL